MEQQVQASASDQRDKPAAMHLDARARAEPASSSAALTRCRNRSRAHWSLFTSHVCEPSVQTPTQSAFFKIPDKMLRPGVLVCVFFFHGIVMVKCIF